MIKQGYEIHAHRNPYRSDGVEIYITRYSDNGQRLIAVRSGDAMTWEELRPHDFHSPTLGLFPERAQELMDELWNAGLRPTQGKQSEGVTAAQSRHLEDMRAIAFERLKVEKPA